MPQIRAGQVTAFYLFDVAEAFKLAAIPALVSGPAVATRLAPRPATPAYVQYENPPLSFDAGLPDAPEFASFRGRFKVYDYGVVSLALTREFGGSWNEFLALGQSVIENDELEARAEQVCRQLVKRLQPALTGYREKFLSEDYTVFAIDQLESPITAEDLLATRGDEIAVLLRGERQALSRQETEQVLRQQLSYLADDLVVPTWNSAFVYDRPAGVQAALEIMEFANSQLLEFRYYDQRLDTDLASLYQRLQRRPRLPDWLGPRYSREIRQVHSLFIEVNELTDRTENALKIVGDIYAARLLSLVSGRLGLEVWKASVHEKLKTVDDLYRFAVEQLSMARGQFLELTVVLILGLELYLALVGIMK